LEVQKEAFRKKNFVIYSIVNFAKLGDKTHTHKDTKMFRLVSSLFVGASVLATARGLFQCPNTGDGYYEDAKQCDLYWDCLDGIAEERLCPDGLVFDPFSRKAEPCDHYFNVDCGDRLQLQEPKGVNDLCPRLNGFYAHPNPNVCDSFYSCVDGVAEEYKCSPGLWFDDYKGVCNWPAETERTDCSTDHQVTENGFKCPKVPVDNAGLLSDPHPKYADPEDCAKFYICLNGVSPRAQGCELGLVYNTVTSQCDAPENVPECKDYYAFLEDDEAQGLKKKANQ